MAGQPTDAAAGTPRVLADRHGRVATDLRLSLTDFCNLRCTYCMPEHGLPWLGRAGLMTVGEVRRLVRIGVGLGVTDLRLTGGEPLSRGDLEEIIAALRAEHPGLPISVTTNAIGLDHRARRLAEAGLTRVNVSLDTLCPHTFARLTRRDLLGRVIEGIDAALAAGLSPVKLNAVLVRGVNDHEAADLVAWALDRGCELRFIENMPLGADRAWARDQLIPGAEIRARLEERYQLVPHEQPRGGAPAQRWRVRENGRDRGVIGVISSVTEPFCADCTRTRLTADGKVRSCLFSAEETDLLTLMRDGADDDAVARRWQDAMRAKPAAHGTDHPVLGTPEYHQPDRPMSAIGG